MKATSFLLLLFVSLGLMTSCAHKDDQILQKDQLTLPHGEWVNHEGAGWLLADSIEDGRCPTDYVCVWEGVALGQITIDIAGQMHQVPFQVKGLCEANPNPCGNTLDTLGYHIQFVQLDPYPLTFNPIPLQDYILKLEVEKL